MTSMPRALRRGDLGDARRAAVDRDDHASRRPPRPRRAPPATGRGPRRAGSARTGSTATPKRRRARVMIASPVSPSASKSPKTRTRSPRSRARAQPGAGAGRRRAAARGSWRPSSGSREPGRRGRRRSTTPRGREQARQPRSRCRAPRPPSTAAGGGRHGVREGPAEAGFDHGVRMPCEAAPRIYRPGASAGLRTPCAGPAGLRVVGQPAVPAVVPELPVDEQRARRRRSTSRSPR